MEAEKEKNDNRRVREYGESIYDTKGKWKERREGQRERERERESEEVICK